MKLHSITLKGLLVVFTLIASGCASDDTDRQCNDACQKLASCSIDPGIAGTLCVWSGEREEGYCDDYYQCRAQCINDRTCVEIQSGDFFSCMIKCNEKKDVVPCYSQPLFKDKEVDLLFVIDNSNSMEHEQKNLNKNFPKLIDALRTTKLGGKIPNVHIGVVSTDLGAGQYNLPSCERSGGDGGKLWNKQQAAGCPAPKDRWISYDDTRSPPTNILGGPTDPISKVKASFQCIAAIGLQGCGFEQTLQSARMALDPTLNVNNGFLRNDPKNNQDALLAVIFVTDEDDCSASISQLFDPSQQGLTDPLGPLTSFRCFEFGVQCECAKGKCDRNTTGPRKNCVPGGKYMHKVENFITFFKNLKKTPDGKPNPRRVLMAAIAGPTERVEVGVDGTNPTLKPSCQTSEGFAVPAVRIKALVHEFARELTADQLATVRADEKQGKTSSIPYFKDKSGKYRYDNFTTICSSDFSPALKSVGEQIVASLGDLCLDRPPLTSKGGIACKAGDLLGTNSKGQQVTCQKSCLDEADMTIHEVTSAGRTSVSRCPSSMFDAQIKVDQCGNSCPCWRIIPSSTCKATKGSSPYQVEVMRKGQAAKGTYATICPREATGAWGTAEFADQKQCN